MNNELIVDKLVNIYKTVEYAPLFFEELASMKSQKPSIDIERRREAINLHHKMGMARHVCHDFFKLLETLKLGKLEIIKERSSGNSKFHWAYQEMRVSKLAQLVIEAAKNSKPSPVSPRTDSKIYVFPLSSGNIVELTRDDLMRLREFIRTVL